MKTKKITETDAYNYLFKNPDGKVKRLRDGHILVNKEGNFFCETCNCGSFRIILGIDIFYEVVEEKKTLSEKRYDSDVLGVVYHEKDVTKSLYDIVEALNHKRDHRKETMIKIIREKVGDRFL